MNGRGDALAERKTALLARSAVFRQAVITEAGPWLAPVDRVRGWLAVVGSARNRPWVIAAAAVALLAVGPRRLARGLLTAWRLWSQFR